MGPLTCNPIIVALDVARRDEALQLMETIGPKIDFYKVGLELFCTEGPALVRELRARGKRVFLDLKFHDIGETVKRAVERAGELDVDLLTVHATGQVMRAAAEGGQGHRVGILGVTVLTSLSQADLAEDGYEAGLGIGALVEKRVRVGLAAGISGFVCSPLEVARVRGLAGPEAVLVTPGVRSAGAAAGDQVRVATPRQALENGASYIVIGRQITRAADPAAEADRIREELSLL